MPYLGLTYVNVILHITNYFHLNKSFMIFPVIKHNTALFETFRKLTVSFTVKLR